MIDDVGVVREVVHRPLPEEDVAAVASGAGRVGGVLVGGVRLLGVVHVRVHQRVAVAGPGETVGLAEVLSDPVEVVVGLHLGEWIGEARLLRLVEEVPVRVGGGERRRVTAVGARVAVLDPEVAPRRVPGAGQEREIDVGGHVVVGDGVVREDAAHRVFEKRAREENGAVARVDDHPPALAQETSGHVDAPDRDEGAAQRESGRLRVHHPNGAGPRDGCSLGRGPTDPAGRSGRGHRRAAHRDVVERAAGREADHHRGAEDVPAQRHEREADDGEAVRFDHALEPERRHPSDGQAAAIRVEETRRFVGRRAAGRVHAEAPRALHPSVVREHEVRAG